MNVENKEHAKSCDKSSFSSMKCTCGAGESGAPAPTQPIPNVLLLRLRMAELDVHSACKKDGSGWLVPNEQLVELLGACEEIDKLVGAPVQYSPMKSADWMEHAIQLGAIGMAGIDRPLWETRQKLIAYLEQHFELKRDSPTKPTYWCCQADFGEHEPTCKNYVVDSPTKG